MSPCPTDSSRWCRARRHIVPYEKPALVAQLVAEFLGSGGEVATMMPVRRA